MKKTKFAVLLTAFMAVLGLSSCLGEPDPYNYSMQYVKILPSGYGFSFMGSGNILLNPTDQSLIGSSLIGKEYAWINFKYEREAVNQNTKEIDIILQSSPFAVDELYNSGRTDESNSYFDYVGLSQYGFPFYDANTMFLDLQYDINNVDEDEIKNELAKHSLDISRLEEQCTSDKVVLKIHHEDLSESNEEKSKINAAEIRYVNLTSLMRGSTPEKLIIKYNKYNAYDETIKEDSCIINYKDIVDSYFNNGYSI